MDCMTSVNGHGSMNCSQLDSFVYVGLCLFFWLVFAFWRIGWKMVVERYSRQLKAVQLIGRAVCDGRGSFSIQHYTALILENRFG